MAMAAETMPRARVHLLVHKHGGEWTVWELVDRVVPATQTELPLDSSPREPVSRRRHDRDPASRCVASVVEVEADGTVTNAWPPTEVTPDEI